MTDLHFYLAAADIAGSVQQGHDITDGFAQQFWSNVFQMGLFGRIAQVAMVIAGIGVIYRGYYYFAGAGKNTLDIQATVGGLGIFIFVLLMLSQSGAGAMYTVMGMRNFTNSIDRQLINGISADFKAFSVNSSPAASAAAQPVIDAFLTSLKICAPKAQKDCYQAAVDDLKSGIAALPERDAAVDAYVNRVDTTFNGAAATTTAPTTLTVPGQQYWATDPRAWAQSVTEGAQALGNSLGDAIQTAIGAILTGLAIAFYFSIELTLLVFGFTFPINLALILFDPSPFKNWLGNFWMLTNAKICFQILVGIIVYLQLWSARLSGGNPLGPIFIVVIQILMAIYAPILTFFYCQGSALALAGAMNSLVSSPMRGALGGAGRAAGGIARGVGGGIASKVGGSTGKKFAGAMSRAGSAARAAKAGAGIAKGTAIQSFKDLKK